MQRRIRQLLLMTLIAPLAGYVAIVLYMYCSQQRMVFFPDSGGRALTRTPTEIGLAFESINLRADDGHKIHGWFVPHAAPGATLLYFHGNAGNVGRRLVPIRRWHDLGLSVLIIDYPGFGESSGEPSESGSYASARAAWTYLRNEKDIPSSDIIIFGRSLGGGVAAQLASEVDAKALILDSTFTSAPDVASGLYPWLPVQTMMHIRFETKDKLAVIDYPVLIMHSPDDEVIPYSHGTKNYEIVTAKKRFVELQGRHSNAPAASEPQYSEQVRKFLREL